MLLFNLPHAFVVMMLFSEPLVEWINLPQDVVVLMLFSERLVEWIADAIRGQKQRDYRLHHDQD